MFYRQALSVKGFSPFEDSICPTFKRINVFFKYSKFRSQGRKRYIYFEMNTQFTKERVYFDSDQQE